MWCMYCLKTSAQCNWPRVEAVDVSCRLIEQCWQCVFKCVHCSVLKLCCVQCTLCISVQWSWLDGGSSDGQSLRRIPAAAWGTPTCKQMLQIPTLPSCPFRLREPRVTWDSNFPALSMARNSSKSWFVCLVAILWYQVFVLAKQGMHRRVEGWGVGSGWEDLPRHNMGGCSDQHCTKPCPQQHSFGPIQWITSRRNPIQCRFCPPR